MVSEALFQKFLLELKEFFGVPCVFGVGLVFPDFNGAVVMFCF